MQNWNGNYCGIRRNTMFGLMIGTCALMPVKQGICAEPTAPTDPILQLMLDKGMITTSEAARVQAESDAIRTNQFHPDISKWKIADDKGIKSMEVFGDVRLRYESRSATDPAGGEIDTQRYRYAVRIG